MGHLTHLWRHISGVRRSQEEQQRYASSGQSTGTLQCQQRLSLQVDNPLPQCRLSEPLLQGLWVNAQLLVSNVSVSVEEPKGHERSKQFQRERTSKVSGFHASPIYCVASPSCGLQASHKPFTCANLPWKP